jgi:hypothetical protein
MELWICHVLELILVLRSMNETRHVVHLEEQGWTAVVQGVRRREGYSMDYYSDLLDHPYVVQKVFIGKTQLHA